ncbi:sigma-B regulation protein RsbU (phosphoserine phosphatase) [Methanofollis sp. W23]|uniref:PAS domain S-box protein n=1 Tax=Methanofollis sp. W23 TaxID=2817849 RepID=UPI001AE3A02C|nr:PAS domain S-box protein [Methanofollis sp. W23]MBP2146722.1 sigma-B regulation protein RsbU (phosphoserine phosphatase) [Methanofollis sp. W23]
MREKPGFDGRCDVVRVFLLTFFLVSLFSASLSPVGAIAPDDSHNVLLLHSYYDGLSWTDDVTGGVQSVLDKEEGVVLYIEYMDMPRVNSPGYEEELIELFRVKYADASFDAIICADEYAFHFLRDHHDDLFPGVPVVFCGVNYFEDAYLEGWDCTGIVEAYDVVGTIDAALALDPGVRRIYVINDCSETGLSNQKVIERAAGEYQGRLEIVSSEGQSLDQVLDTVAALPPDAIVLLMTFYLDQDGTSYDYDEVVGTVSAASPVPVYGVWDIYLGEGLVGGRLTSGEDQGTAAGRLALRVLEGESASKIPVEADLQGTYRFDYRQLDRFGLQESDLPAGSTVIHAPNTAVEIDREVLAAVIIALVTLLLLVGFLAYTIRVRKKTEHALKKSEQKFREIAERSFDVIFITDADGEYTYLSPSVRRVTGYTPEELVGRSYRAGLREKWKKIVEDAIAALKSGEVVEGVEVCFYAKDGSPRHLEINAAPIMVEGAVAGAQGVVRDVTERREMERVREEAYAQIDQNIAQFATLGDEIRNPLSVIVGLADLNCDERDAEQILEQARIIDAIIDRLDQGWIESEKVQAFLRKRN